MLFVVVANTCVVLDCSYTGYLITRTNFSGFALLCESLGWGEQVTQMDDSCESHHNFAH